MTLSRRDMLGGGLLAALSLSSSASAADDIVEIGMRGRADGSHVWFDPIGILVRPGQTIRWTNMDPGNSHTSTAYNPANDERQRRMPQAAKSWNSDYLLPRESFSVTLIEPGVYDYCCIPHEHAGMVGRIIVGCPDPPGWKIGADADSGVPEAALKAFPKVDEIMRMGIVRVS